MHGDTLKYKPEIAIRNYGIVFGLLLITFLFLKIGGNPSELILLKLAVVPLGFLAWKGLISLYRQPIIEHSFTIRAFEYSILLALLSTLLCFIVIWRPEMSAPVLIKKLGFNFVFFSAMSIFAMYINISKMAKLRRDEKSNNA